MICGDCGHDENCHDSKTEKCELWDDEGERCPCNGFCEPDESVLVDPAGDPVQPQVFGVITPIGFVRVPGIEHFEELIEQCAQEGVRKFHEYRRQKEASKPPVKSGSAVPDSLEAWCREKPDGKGKGTAGTSSESSGGGAASRAPQEEDR